MIGSIRSRGPISQSAVMVDLIVGQYRYDGTTCAPGEQSPAVPGGASSRVTEVARRMRTKLTPAGLFEGVLPVIKSLCGRMAPKTRAGRPPTVPPRTPYTYNFAHMCPGMYSGDPASRWVHQGSDMAHL